MCELLAYQPSVWTRPPHEGTTRLRKVEQQHLFVVNLFLLFEPKFLMYQFCFIVLVSCGSMYVTQHMSVQSAETLISSAQLRTVIGVLSSYSAKSVQPTEYPNLLHQISTRLSLSTTLCYRSQH